MILPLLNQIVEKMREELNNVVEFPSPETKIQLGAVSEPDVSEGPHISIYPEVLEVSQKAMEIQSSEARPQNFREAISVNQPLEGEEDQSAGPYPLAQQALKTSILCKVIYDEGGRDERQILLVEKTDFDVDYNNATITFKTNISEADTILLSYSYVGVFTIREFSQDFLMDVFANTLPLTDQWSALAIAMILTNRDELLKAANDVPKYAVENYLSSAKVSQLTMLSQQPELSTAISRYQVRFEVQGQFMPEKAIEDGFFLIDQIRSIGKTGASGTVDIDIAVE